MKTILTAAAISLCAMVLALGSVQAQEKYKTIDKNSPYTVVANDYSTMCARGVTYSYYQNGKTYFTWAGLYMNPQITVVDSATGEIAKPVQIREYNYKERWAYHDYPTMLVDKKGTVHVFMAYHCQKLHYLRSQKGGDINGEWKETVIEHPTGYPFPILTSDGSMFVFFILNKDPKYDRPERPLYYIYSKDGGDSWSDTVRCMNRDFDNVKEIYIGSMKLAPKQGKYPERILLTGTLAGVGGHNQCHKDIYYAYMDVKTMKMYSATKKDLGTLIEGEDEWREITLLDTGESFTRPYAVGHNANVITDPKTGHPMVGYEYINPKKGFTTTFVMWNGKRWGEPMPTPRGTRITDMFVDEKGKLTAYVVQGNVLYGYQYNGTEMQALGKWEAPDMKISTVVRAGNYSGYKPAQFVFFEKVENIKTPTGAYKVGFFDGTLKH